MFDVSLHSRSANGATDVAGDIKAHHCLRSSRRKHSVGLRREPYKETKSKQRESSARPARSATRSHRMPPGGIKAKRASAFPTTNTPLVCVGDPNKKNRI